MKSAELTVYWSSSNEKSESGRIDFIVVFFYLSFGIESNGVCVLVYEELLFREDKGE